VDVLNFGVPERLEAPPLHTRSDGSRRRRTLVASFPSSSHLIPRILLA
jgi:hypothetical protein